MRNYEITIENGEVTSIKNYDEKNGGFFDGNLFIPKEVINIFASESVIDLYPEDIVVEEGNKIYCAKKHCLFTKDGKELLMLSKKSTIPGDTKILGSSVYALPCNSVLQKVSDALVDGLEEIRYRALAATSEEEVDLTIPASVKKIDLMALMIYAPYTTIEFLGDPELTGFVFGTKAEALGLSDEYNDIYKTLPDILYIQPQNIMVVAKVNSNVAEYCKKYGIPVAEKREK